MKKDAYLSGLPRLGCGRWARRGGCWRAGSGVRPAMSCCPAELPPLRVIADAVSDSFSDGAQCCCSTGNHDILLAIANVGVGQFQRHPNSAPNFGQRLYEGSTHTGVGYKLPEKPTKQGCENFYTIFAFTHLLYDVIFLRDDHE